MESDNELSEVTGNNQCYQPIIIQAQHHLSRSDLQAESLTQPLPKYQLEANTSSYVDAEANNSETMPVSLLWEENQMLKKNCALLQQQCNNMSDEIAKLRSFLAVDHEIEETDLPRKLPRVNSNCGGIHDGGTAGGASPITPSTNNLNSNFASVNNNNFNSNSHSYSSTVNNNNNNNSSAIGAKKKKKVLQAIDTDISKVNRHLKANNCNNYFVKQTTNKAPVKIVITDEQEIPTIKQHLANANVSYHEYKWDSEKRKSFIIKGLVGASEEDIPFIKNQLVLAGLPEQSTVSLFRSGYMRSNPQLKHNTLIQLTLPPNTDTKLIGSIKYIDHVAVKIEPQKNSKFLQCKNCQRFGHVASGCQHVHRCVKCGANHYKNECPRSTNKSIKLQCCNCGGEHTANNVHECSFAQQFINSSSNNNSNINGNNINKTNSKRNAMREISHNNSRQLIANNNNSFVPKSSINSNSKSNSASTSFTATSDSYPNLPSFGSSSSLYKNLRFSNTTNTNSPNGTNNNNISFAQVLSRTPNSSIEPLGNEILNKLNFLINMVQKHEHILTKLTNHE